MKKTKIAIFDLTGCEGCEFHLLNLNELLMEFFQDFEITNWRLMKEKKKADFDVAFIEGAVTKKEHIKLLKEIRETSKVVVSLGMCAVSGNFFAHLTKEQRKKYASKIYGKNYNLKAKFLEPVKNFIKVDKEIPGCPPNIEDVKNLLKELKKRKITSKIKKITPPDYQAKIEGHGTLKINFKENKATFEVEESERLVEGLVMEKNFKLAPFIVSRICGICPVAHNICSISAIENSLKIKPKEEVILLRKLLFCAQFIKSHLLHLFFLVLPDYAKTKGAIELSKKYPAEFHLMLNIKRVADNILNIVGGSKSFPQTTEIGGFKKIPKKEELLKIREEIFDVLDEAEDLINLFSSLKVPQINTNTFLLSTHPQHKTYPYYPVNLSLSFKEVVRRNSTAKFVFLKPNKIIKVGALARLYHYHRYLNKKAKLAFEKKKFNLKNPFNNNLAQAIEILHFLEESVILIEKLSKKNLKKAERIKDLPAFKNKNLKGECFVEAPRGVLFHQIKLDSCLKIKNYTIIPPTQINLASLEEESNALLKILKHKPKEEKRKEIEKLIRAFDPCITCAVH